MPVCLPACLPVFVLTVHSPSRIITTIPPRPPLPPSCLADRRTWLAVVRLLSDCHPTPLDLAEISMAWKGFPFGLQYRSLIYMCLMKRGVYRYNWFSYQTPRKRGFWNYISNIGVVPAGTFNVQKETVAKVNSEKSPFRHHIGTARKRGFYNYFWNIGVGSTSKGWRQSVGSIKRPE